MPARSTPAGTAGTGAPSRTRCPPRARRRAQPAAPSGGPSAPGLPDDDHHHAGERDDAQDPSRGVEAGPRQVGEPAQEDGDQQQGNRPDQARHGEPRYQQPQHDQQQDPPGQLMQENQGPGAEALHGLPGLRGARLARAAGRGGAAGRYGAAAWGPGAAGAGPARALPAGARPPAGPCLAALRHSVILPWPRGPSGAVTFPPNIRPASTPAITGAQEAVTGRRHTRAGIKLGARALVPEAHTRPPTASRMEFHRWQTAPTASIRSSASPSAAAWSTPPARSTAGCAPPGTTARS